MSVPISGPSKIFNNQEAIYSLSVSYSIYSWSVSSGGVIVGASDQQTVNVLWNGVGFNTLSVVVTNPSDNGNLTVEVISEPVVEGQNQVAVGSTETYTTTNHDGNTYNWEVNGGNILSGQGTNELNVQWTTEEVGFVMVTETIPNTSYSDENTLNVTITLDWRDYNPQNDLNPQDSIGEDHNLLLEYFVENINDICSDGTKDFSIICDTIYLLLPKVIELLNITPDTQTINNAFGASCACMIKIGDTVNTYLDITDYSVSFQNLFNQINNTINQLTINNISSILGQLKDIDTQIGNSSLGDSEKTIIYQVNSVARYSSAYWVSEKNNPDSSWIDISSGRGGSYQTKNPPNWVYSDITSFYIGALCGGLIGALIGSALTSALTAGTDAYNKKK